MDGSHRAGVQGAGEEEEAVYVLAEEREDLLNAFASSGWRS